MHTFELPKLPKEDDGTVKWRWGRFLTAETKEELDMLKERYEELKHPVAKLLHLSADEEARREYERREKIIRDHESGLYFARNEGIAEGKAKGKAEGIAKGKAEGIAEGKAEGKAEIARAMLHDGMQVSLIARFTGLAPEEIELLKTH
jgi:flagellar biosynthesis/type III secretory pathway protein FliH